MAKKAKITTMTCCRECAHAILHDMGIDPMIAECTKKPQPWSEKFPYEREVANAMKICQLFKVKQ